MNFWALNKTKVMRLSFLYLLIGLLMFVFFYVLSGHDVVVIVIPLLFVIFMVLVDIIRGTNFFKAMKRFAEDNSEKSITPLFDNGYTLALDNLESKFRFTKESFKGRISGLPVRITLLQRSRGSGPVLEFDFYPLLKPGLENNESREVSFNLGFGNKLKKDVKPDVKKFAEELRAEGYISAE